MKKFIFIILFINILSKTSDYYSSCKAGAPKTGFVTVSDCKEYEENGSHCCLLKYGNNPDVEINIDVSVDNGKLSDESEVEGLDKDKKRVLDEIVNICYGISNNGYNNIDKVISELEDESGIDGIEIDCLARKIKFNSIIIALILYIFL